MESDIYKEYLSDFASILDDVNDLMSDLEDLRDDIQDAADENTTGAEKAALLTLVTRADAALSCLDKAADALDD